MTLRQPLTAAVLGVLLGAQLLFSAGALANLDTGEATDPAHDHDSYLVITSPAPRRVVTAGETLKIAIVLNKPFKGYNGVDVKIANATPREPPGKFLLKSKVSYLPAARQKDGSYLATYAVPANYSGWLWMMPEDVGDGLFNARAGHYVLVEVKPAAAKTP